MDKDERLVGIGNCSYDIVKRQKELDRLLDQYQQDFAYPPKTIIRFKRKFPDLENDPFVSISIKATFRGIIQGVKVDPNNFNFYYIVHCTDLNDMCTVWENQIVEAVGWKDSKNV